MREEEDLALEIGGIGVRVDPLRLSLPPPGDPPIILLLLKFVKEEEADDKFLEI
jgi:hypothetical protein